MNESGKIAGAAIKTDPKKWEQAKADAKERMGGKHSARAMQLATQLYKKRGGGYSGSKPTAKSNSLKKWGKQKWKWSGGSKDKGVYLPSSKVERLKSSKKGKKELREAGRKKSKATREGKQYSSHGLASGTALKKEGSVNALEKYASKKYAEMDFDRPISFGPDVAKNPKAEAEYLKGKLRNQLMRHVAGGGGAGAILGSNFGGLKGAAIGALLGAGGGALTGRSRAHTDKTKERVRRELASRLKVKFKNKEDLLRWRVASLNSGQDIIRRPDGKNYTLINTGRGFATIPLDQGKTKESHMNALQKYAAKQTLVLLLKEASEASFQRKLKNKAIETSNQVRRDPAGAALAVGKRYRRNIVTGVANTTPGLGPVLKATDAAKTVARKGFAWSRR